MVTLTAIPKCLRHQQLWSSNSQGLQSLSRYPRFNSWTMVYITCPPKNTHTKRFIVEYYQSSLPPRTHMYSSAQTEVLNSAALLWSHVHNCIIQGFPRKCLILVVIPAPKNFQNTHLQSLWNELLNKPELNRIVWPPLIPDGLEEEEWRPLRKLQLPWWPATHTQRVINTYNG
jgi:hypothetical protein